MPELEEFICYSTGIPAEVVMRDLIEKFGIQKVTAAIAKKGTNDPFVIHNILHGGN